MVYSVEFRQEAVAAVDAGERVSVVSARLGIHHDTLWLWLQLRKKTGSLEAQLPKVERKLTDAHREVLYALCLANQGATNKALAKLFEEATGVRVIEKTIYSERLKLGFVRVRVPKGAARGLVGTTGKPGCYAYVPLVPKQGYPSDLTDAQWELVEPLIPKPTSPRPARDRRQIVNAILYVLRTGCQWRLLPHDFPPHGTVYALFRQWQRSGVWERLNTALREQARTRSKRQRTPSAASVDSQTAKTTEKGGCVDMTAESA